LKNELIQAMVFQTAAGIYGVSRWIINSAHRGMAWQAISGCRTVKSKVAPNSDQLYYVGTLYICALRYSHWSVDIIGKGVNF
jgi:hypothetical protein